MYCMYRHLAPYQNDTNVLPFVKFLNDRIYEVRRKLRKAQTSITLTSPDLTKLTASLKKVVNQEVEVIKAADEAEKAKDDSEKAAANLVTANFSISASKAIPAAVTAALINVAAKAATASAKETKSKKQQQTQLENHLNSCVAMF